MHICQQSKGEISARASLGLKSSFAHSDTGYCGGCGHMPRQGVQMLAKSSNYHLPDLESPLPFSRSLTYFPALFIFCLVLFPAIPLQISMFTPSQCQIKVPHVVLACCEMLRWNSVTPGGIGVICILAALSGSIEISNPSCQMFYQTQSLWSSYDRNGREIQGRMKWLSTLQNKDFGRDQREHKAFLGPEWMPWNMLPHTRQEDSQEYTLTIYTIFCQDLGGIYTSQKFFTERGYASLFS